MSKYIDAEKLVAGLKHLQEKFEFLTYEAIYHLIDSLQQEQPQIADASKMERLNVDAIREWSMRFAPDIRNAIEATAYHFWNLAIYSRKEK